MSDRLLLSTLWLLLEEGSLSSLLHVPSAFDWCRQDFQAIEAQFFQTVISWCRLELQAVKTPSPAFIRWMTSNTWCSLLLVSPGSLSPPFLLLAWVSAATTQEAFSCWRSAAAWRGSGRAAMLVTHGCVCLMGFYCLENATERVTANLFRKRVCGCVCVFVSPSSFSQNNKLSLQHPLGNWSHTESNKGCFSLWRWTLVPHPGLQEHFFYISLAIHSQLVILRILKLFEDLFFMLIVLIFPVTFLICSQTHSSIFEWYFLYLWFEKWQQMPFSMTKTNTN